jgi:phospholipase/carboxylesterase
VPVQRRREAAGEPAGSLVLLHGRGADEDDLFPLLDVLDPERRLLGITPGGPLALPPGGRHWYVVPRVGFPDPETFRASLAELTALVGELPRPLVLGGFSQGAVMSLALLGAGVRPAAVVALSGFVPTVPGWALPAELAGLPVALGHGTADPVIGIGFGRDARERLEAAGAAVTYRESPMGHTIDPRFLGELPAFARMPWPVAGRRRPGLVNCSRTYWTVGREVSGPVEAERCEPLSTPTRGPDT